MAVDGEGVPFHRVGLGLALTDELAADHKVPRRLATSLLLEVTSAALISGGTMGE